MKKEIKIIKDCGIQKNNEKYVGSLLFSDTSNWRVFEISKEDSMYIHNSCHTNYWWTTCHDHNQTYINGGKEDFRWYIVIENTWTIEDVLKSIMEVA